MFTFETDCEDIIDLDLEINIDYFCENSNLLKRFANELCMLGRECSSPPQPASQVLTEEKQVVMLNDYNQWNSGGKVMQQMKNPEMEKKRENDNVMSILDGLERVDIDCVEGIFQDANLKRDRFNGMMPATIRKDEMIGLQNGEWFLSIKLDGVRAWLIVCDGKVYIQDRTSSLYFYGNTMCVSNYVIDVEMICSEKNRLDFYCLDMPYCDMWLLDVPFALRLLRLFTVDFRNLSPVRNLYLQRYYTLGCYDKLRRRVMEGFVFTRSHSKYVFKMSRDILTWKFGPLTVDLLFRDGLLFSASYDSYCRFKGYKKEGRISRHHKLNSCIVEVYLPADGGGNVIDQVANSSCESESDRIFNPYRVRRDKKFPNSSTVVKEILQFDKDISIPFVHKKLSSCKVIYGKEYCYSLYKISDDCLSLDCPSIKQRVCVYKKEIDRYTRILLSIGFPHLFFKFEGDKEDES